jgi:hypothetical protein
MNPQHDKVKIDAVLRHLGCGHELRDFPGTAAERLALIRTAASRGLIAWHKARTRYELTPVGWSELMPRRRFTLTSLLASAAAGAAVGAAALAMFWLPADASHRLGERHAAPAAVRLERVNTAPVLSPDEAQPAPAQTASTAQPATSSVGQNPAPAATPLTEPAKVAEQPVAEPPAAEPAPEVKQAAVKKPHRKTASRRRKEEAARQWADADRPLGYSAYGGQGYGFYR